MDIYKTLQDRRSVRKYMSDPIPDEKLKRILDAARLAPSWSNQQCWRFIVVRDREQKEKLAASVPENNPARKAVEQTAPAVIVLCADPEASGKQDGKDYYLLDSGLAMQQLMLAAHAERLGTCWVAWFDESKAREACEVPEEFRVVALTPLGYPEKEPSPKPRKDLKDIVYGEKFGKEFSLK